MIERANKLINTLDIKGLRELWLRTDRVEEKDGKSLVRGLVMDRLEVLNPGAFETWLEADNDTDFSMFY